MTLSVKWFVSGHEFTRAENAAKRAWALAPAEQRKTGILALLAEEARISFSESRATKSEKVPRLRTFCRIETVESKKNADSIYDFQRKNRKTENSPLTVRQKSAFLQACKQTNVACARFVDFSRRSPLLQGRESAAAYLSASTSEAQPLAQLQATTQTAPDR